MELPPQEIRQQVEWKPIPDPTTLTTAQLRELREEMFRALQCQREIFDARLKAADDATNRFRENLPRDLNLHIDTIANLFGEKLAGHERSNDQRFSAIDVRFHERGLRHDQMSTASTIALDARFVNQQNAAAAAAAANEKAMGKSEDATKEKIDSLQALLTGSINDIRGQIATLTSRQDRAEGASKGVVDNASDRRGQTGMVIGVSSLAALFITMIVGATLFVVTRNNPPPYSPTVSYSAPAPTVVAPAVVPLGTK